MKNSIRTGAVTAATIAGVAGVLVLNPTGEAAISSAASPTSSVTAPDATDDSTSNDDTSPGEDAAGGDSSTATGGRASPSAPTLAATATYTGEVYSTPYGPMQVEATIQDGVIVDITWISLPADRHSQRINDYAGPALVEEALAAQSAQVDTISGATWTSEGFRYSLQSILTEAGL